MVIPFSMLGFMHNGHDSIKVSSFCNLMDLSCLENLNLEGIQLRDDAINPLLNLRNLKYLYLRSEYLSNLSFLTLASLSCLKILGFQGAVLTDSGFLSYVPHDNLQKLDLRDCWLLTEEAISLFSKRYPMIDLVHELKISKVNSKSVREQNQAKQRRVRREEPKGTTKTPFAGQFTVCLNLCFNLFSISTKLWLYFNKTVLNLMLMFVNMSDGTSLSLE
jgi:hypothetical protein